VSSSAVLRYTWSGQAVIDPYLSRASLCQML